MSAAPGNGPSRSFHALGKTRPTAPVSTRPSNAISYAGSIRLVTVTSTRTLPTRISLLGKKGLLSSMAHLVAISGRGICGAHAQSSGPADGPGSTTFTGADAGIIPFWRAYAKRPPAAITGPA